MNVQEEYCTTSNIGIGRGVSKNVKFLCLSSLCNGKGTDRQAILYTDRSCFSNSIIILDFMLQDHIRSRGYKTFFMLNSTEHEIFPAHQC